MSNLTYQQFKDMGIVKDQFIEIYGDMHYCITQKTTKEQVIKNMRRAKDVYDRLLNTQLKIEQMKIEAENAEDIGSMIEAMEAARPHIKECGRVAKEILKYKEAFDRLQELHMQIDGVLSNQQNQKGLDEAQAEFDLLFGNLKNDLGVNPNVKANDQNLGQILEDAYAKKLDQILPEPPKQKVKSNVDVNEESGNVFGLIAEIFNWS